MMDLGDNLRQKIALLPQSPGCYLMKERGEVIYVGKAVNLANRVRSYFSSQPKTAKTQALVERIDDFDVILAATNLEALVLESNLIKLHRPRFNIRLMDDKHYPFIRISVQEPFPRLTVARKIEQDGAKYFGPYYGAAAIRQVTGVLRRVFPLRTCTLKLPLARPQRPCINYEMGLCLGPCAGLVSQEDYRLLVDEVIGFLKGRHKPVLERLERDMAQASRELQFERAAELRDSIRDVHGLMEQQNAQQAGTADRDVIAVARDGLDAMAQVLFIRGGKLLEAQSYTLTREGSEPVSDILEGFLQQFYEDRPPAREVIVQDAADPATLEAWLRDRRGAPVTLVVPRRGDKAQLVQNAVANAEDALRKRNARDQVVQERTVGASRELASALSLYGVPRRIEGFDVSNTQGAQSVASMVVFVDGEPKRGEYRHFRIKTVEGANDFASMHEVITRRLRRTQLPQGAWPVPDLVLVDGGPEQLAFAIAARDALGMNVPMFGLAKRFEEIWIPGADQPIVLDRHSPALHLVQRIRDEAHRFAVTHHRKLRGKASVRSRLEEVPGVGPARRRALLAAFRSVQGIKEQTVDALAAVPGMSRPAAEALHRALHGTPGPAEGTGADE
ncbi:MAG TPA: excinuclease ABC subunit UvrC [Candidatus Limnocylindria bacterium]|nr:excinuclease ABC subunit UvrC [Candidatus Limnocylindria bacterium]